MTRTTKTISAVALALGLVAAAAPGTAQHAGSAADPSQLFTVAGNCMACHNGLTAPTGEDISIGTRWRASMMANAARDPYWQAAVKRETMDHPSVATAIQDECSKCHMPMARFQAHAAGREFEFFGALPWQGGAGVPAAVKALAADGVSCTACHQIQDEGLGEESTFTGEFHIDTETPMGERVVFGPYDVPEGSARAMMSSGLFLPAQGAHIRESGVCASCHTLFTHARNDEGEVVGELPEQVPYLEWLHSEYTGSRSCQSCHMPPVEGETNISSVLPNPRPDVRQHVFRGGNFFIPRVLNAFRGELATAALPAELDAMAAATEMFLRTRAARVDVTDVSRESGRVAFDVHVTSLAGHKLPTAYPSRRAWLHVTVTAEDGTTLFESGALRPDGSIVGNDNDGDGARFEPHYRTIRTANEVQVYEAIILDHRGDVTTGLVYGLEYAKDNRVLPAGFDKRTAGEDIAVQGRAVGDDDFVGGGDRVRYELDLGAVRGPVTVTAELWYQPIGFRWAKNLGEYDAPEPNRFGRYYDALSTASARLLAENQAVLQPE